MREPATVVDIDMSWGAWSTVNVPRDDDGRTADDLNVTADEAHADLLLLLLQQLKRERERFAMLAEYSTDVVYELDLDGNIVWISAGVRDMLGWDPVELVGTPSLDLVHREDQRPLKVRREVALSNGTKAVTSARFRTSADGYRWMSARSQPLFDADGVAYGLVVGLRDVQDEHSMRQELDYLAHHDLLTGLHNRSWVLDILESDIAVARRENMQVALLFLDLDNFKVINDSLGHIIGDEVLTATAHRIQSTLRPGDRVGRFGGDEFVVVAPGIRFRHDVESIAERLCAAVVDEVQVGNRMVTVSASIGIALSNGTSTPLYMLRDADSALFRAKAAGRSRWEFADPDTHIQAMSRLDTEAELRTAIAERQFMVHYQPIVALGDGSVVGHEALVRWNHPRRGLLAPSEFLQVAEDTGLILAMEDLVFRDVCELLNNRPELTGPISVNKSPAQISRPGWHDQILEQLDTHGVDPSRIIIEFTETAILSVLERTRSELVDLRRRGVGIHVDDFGTGYSSITLLRDLPVTGLKLDLSFTQHVTTDETARALASGIAGLSQGLGLLDIAEGIETPEQAAALREQGWRHGQGYLYGRPSPDPVTTASPS